MQYTGKVIYVGPLETIGDNGTQKFTMVIEEITEREYPGSIAVDFWGERAQRHNQYHVGDVVTAHLNSRSREYNGRYYNSISAWKVIKDKNDPSNVDEDEDLPF